MDDYDIGNRKGHVRYFLHCLNVLPERYAYLDSQRLVIAHFALGGLSLLEATNAINNKQEYIDWIYSLQSPYGGFFGSEIMKHLPHSLAKPHIASTFAAIQCLIVLGDDLEKVKVPELLSWLRSLMNLDGSFQGASDASEPTDLRFTYCAAFIHHIFGSNSNEFSSGDIQMAVEYVVKCQSPDTAFGQVPGAEGHGALTFCALASLKLFGYLHSCKAVLSSSELKRIVRFCVNRQSEGIHGRPNKPDDTCYTFWTCAALKLAQPSIDISEKLDKERVLKFVRSCVDENIGGIKKLNALNTYPDVTHSYLALAGLGVIFNDVVPEYLLKKSFTKRALRVRNMQREQPLSVDL